MLSSLSDVLKKDFFAGAQRWRLPVYLANNDLIIRYKRSWLGISWVLISFSLFIGAKILVFGAVANKDLSYFAIYLSIGYMVFKFLSAVIVDGANSLIVAEGWIKGEALPISIYIYRIVIRNLIVASYTLPPVIALCLYFKAFNLIFLWSILPVLLIYLINAVWVSALLGILCARHRDLVHLIAMGMSLVYFLTPVLWVQPETGYLALVAQYNPFTYYINILRVPLLDGVIPIGSWQIVGAFTLGGLLLTMWVFTYFRHKLIYWL